MKAMVTGGGGFLGEALVRALLARGDEVHVVARGDYPHLASEGARLFRGDIRDPDTLRAACEGVDAVFHTAARAGGWGPVAEYESINIQGTRNVIAACREARVPSLIYTSTPSVVHAGRDIEGEDESLPYATRFLAHYPRTKAQAEREVRKASDASLRTISIRPHFIWGPGDRHLLPRLLDRVRAGRMRKVGGGDPLVDTTYIDNCVHAHLLAAERLHEGAPLGGSVYFISDGAPIGVWTMSNRMLAAAGAPPISRSVPAWAAMAAGTTFEALHFALRRSGEPLMTRFAASQLAHAQWFDISAARNELGYQPLVSIDEGLERLGTSYVSS